MVRNWAVHLRKSKKKTKEILKICVQLWLSLEHLFKNIKNSRNDKIIGKWSCVFSRIFLLFDQKKNNKYYFGVILVRIIAMHLLKMFAQFEFNRSNGF